MKELLRNSDWMYALFEEKSGAYRLSVTCGSIGMYEVKIRLNADEVMKYNNAGENFIKELAMDISKNTNKYQNRIISNS